MERKIKDEPLDDVCIEKAIQNPRFRLEEIKQEIKVESCLVDDDTLRIMKAIDNRGLLGDVGDMDSDLLEQVLPHCSKEELIRIEKSTKGRDLSPITDKHWKRIFLKEFGIKAAESVMEKMKQRKVLYKWSKVYEAKLKSLEKAENEVGIRLKKLYQKEDSRKQSRQVRVCEKIPTSTRNKSSCCRRASGQKSEIMKKAIKEYLNCIETNNRRASRRMKREGMMRRNGSTTPIKKPSVMYF